MKALRFQPFGKTGTLVRVSREAAGTASLSEGQAAHALSTLAERLRRASVIVDVVVAYDELLVTWWPTADAHAVLAFVERAFAAQLLEPSDAVPSGRRHTLAVIYEGADLAEVAHACGLSNSEVVRRHCAPVYRVDAVGFQPGFAYLGTLDELLRLPRRSVPRVRVPPSSLAIAGPQTAIYPHASPGGWHLIGRLATPLFAPTGPLLSEKSVATFAVGDTVKFIELSV